MKSFNSYEVTVTDFCKENTTGELVNASSSKEIKFKIRKASIFIPIDEAAIFPQLLNEIIKIC